MLISIDEYDSRPIYQQIVNQVKGQIERGELKQGDDLPSVRELAGSLGINLHTVRNAYQKLRDQGLISLRLGRRARIAMIRRRPVNSEEVDNILTKRLGELKTEAFLMGLSAREFKGLFNRILDKTKKERK